MEPQEPPTELLESPESLESPEPPQPQHMELQELLDFQEPPMGPPELLVLTLDQELLVNQEPQLTKESPISEDQESAEVDTHIKPKNTDFPKSTIIDYI